ncbi:MAG: type IX secretion system membrane protein PorP/SprF [bacterium]|nr:type IX secretion system membrane protein PorP/SprF [bacterium]
MRRHLILLAVTVLSGTSGFAQYEFHQSQYMVHQPFLNPASAGAAQSLNAALFYRQQWVGFDGAPAVGGFNINSPLGEERKNSIGLTLLNDRIGVNNNSQISANYAYSLIFENKSRLAFGASASLNMNQSDYSQVNTTVVDPTFQEKTPLITTPNFKFGTYYHTKKFYVGFAIPNLLHNSIVENGGFEGETTFDVSKMHFYLQGGYLFKLNDDWNLKTSTLLKQVSGAPFQADINMFGEYLDRFGLGLSYRTSNELALIAMFGISDAFHISYSYDLTFNPLRTYSTGSHEVMLVYTSVKNGTDRKAMPRF